MQVRRNGAQMETLPNELRQRIFSSLSFCHLASAARVCRSWKQTTNRPELWENLYVQRWGREEAVNAVNGAPKSWKSAYEARDRCDRVGRGWVVVRERDCIYTCKRGLLLRLVARVDGDKLSASTAPPKPPLGSTDGRPSSASPVVPIGGTVCNADAPASKLLKFVADLHYEQRRLTKRSRNS